MSNFEQDLASDLVENMPEPQEHAILEEQEKLKASGGEPAKKPGTVSDGPRDPQGNSFDPAKHQSNSDGTPKLSPKTGRLMKLRKPRAARSSVAQPDAPLQGGGEAVQTRMAATATIESIGMLGRMLGGEEWAFVRSVEHGIDEKASGIDAFDQYYTAKGVTDIPPGVIIAIWALSYIGPRLAMPTTKSRMQLGWAWVKNKVSRNKKGPESVAEANIPQHPPVGGGS